MTTPTSKISQTLNFFLEHNPGHAIGDCLCICAPINFSNFFSGVKKSFVRLTVTLTFALTKKKSVYEKT